MQIQAVSQLSINNAMPGPAPTARTFYKRGGSGADGQDALHLQFGPIDLIIECDASERERNRLFQLAQTWFEPVLHTLVGELPLLRQPLTERSASLLSGVIARRMVKACTPYRHRQVTPMAAVAGAVADDCLAHLTRATSASRIWVNNGGDIAVWLSDTETFTVGMIPDNLTGVLDGKIVLDANSGIRGIATSGRASSTTLSTGDGRLTTPTGGRSFSLGIADAVTVVAHSAAGADVAATLIANAVDPGDHPAITRLPAITLDPDSDLGQRLVVTDVNVDALSADEAELAVLRGVQLAQTLCSQSLIAGAAIRLGGCYRTVFPGHSDARYLTSSGVIS